MKYKVTEQWRPRQSDLCILYLDNPKIVTTPDDDYRNFLIEGVIYKPIPMSHGNGKVIAINGEGNFVGKEVEFIKEEP